MCRFAKVISVLIFVFLSSLSDTSVYAESVSDSLENYVSDIKGDIPGSGTNEYANPTAQNKTDFGAIIDLIRTEDFSQADTDADALGYSLITLTDTGNSKVYYILREDDPTVTDGWGTYIFDLTSTKDILIEAPHPRFDLHTWRIAINLFQDSNAKVFLMAGTHRNSNDAGDESDMAHTDSSMFQYVHEKESTADTITLQVHGFSLTPPSRAGYPDIVMSNGTATAPAEFAGLETLLEDSGSSFTVGTYDGVDYSDLAGTTNDQGKHTNTLANGLFYHQELSSDVRGDATEEADYVTAVSTHLDIGHFAVTGTATQTAGGSQTVTVTAKRADDTTFTAYTGDHNIIFSGLSAAPNGTNPTCSDKDGVDVNIGTATTLTFSAGVATTTLKTYKAETASLDADDGTYDSTGDASYDLDITVSPAGLNDYTVSATTPQHDYVLKLS